MNKIEAIKTYATQNPEAKYIKDGKNEGSVKTDKSKMKDPKSVDKNALKGPDTGEKSVIKGDVTVSGSEKANAIAIAIMKKKAQAAAEQKPLSKEDMSAIEKKKLIVLKLTASEDKKDQLKVSKTYDKKCGDWSDNKGPLPTKPNAYKASLVPTKVSK